MIFLTLTGSTMEENRLLWEKNRSYIDGLELRADLLEKNQRPLVASFPQEVKIPVILTCRKPQDGGCWQETEERRAEFFYSQLRSGFAYFDFEEDFSPLSKEELSFYGVKLIRSRHDFSTIPHDFQPFLKSVHEQGEIPKLAVKVNSASELSEFFKRCHEMDFPKIVIAMGVYGFASRILTKKSGSLLTFTSSEGSLATLGQISPQEMVETYRYRQLSKETPLYVLTGNPLSQSQSPRIHNAFLESQKKEGVFLPLQGVDFQDFLTAARALEVKAAAVTVPFKEEAAKASEVRSQEVEFCGASNSLVFSKGKIHAFNTDMGGFLKPLLALEPSLKGKRVVVFGAGGAAAACVGALRQHEAEVIILNRTVEKARLLAKRFGCEFGRWQDCRELQNVSILVQASAAGMVDFESVDPAALYPYRGDEIAYDIVYKPPQTPFLSHAQKAGCRCLYGLQMLEAQAQMQFELFYS